MLKFSRVILPMALTVCGIANAADFTVDGLTYTTLSENTVSVQKFVEGSEIVIPEKVTNPETNTEYDVVQIAIQSFYNAAIKSVSVPGSVKYIEPYAFWKSTAETVTIAEGTEDIGYGAFRECTRLTSISLPESLKVLGSVWDMTGLGGAVFHGCSALQEITIPASITTIPQMTFCECAYLSKVTLPETLTEIEERAFELCSSLKSISFPESITTLGHGVFNKSGLENPTVPGTIKIIPSSAFLWCQNMTAFTIEEGVEEIGKSAFADCRGYTEVRVPNSVEWIRSDAFQGNEHVKEIHLGSGVRRMGHACLAVWAPDENNVPHWALTDIYVDSPVPPVHEQNDDHFDLVADDFFFGEKDFKEELRNEFYTTVRLHVPEDAVEAYRNADIWKNFTNVNGKEYNGVEGIIADSQIRIEGGIVYADAIEVFTTAGMRVAAAAGEFDLNTLGTGLYIVRSGNQSVKAVVR